MAIIIKDHEPAGDLVAVQLPGSKTRYDVPNAEDFIDGDWLELANTNPWDALKAVFPEAAHEQVRKLKKRQIMEFIKAWSDDDSGNSPASRG